VATETTTAIEALAEGITRKYPDATVSIERPADPEKPWFLDARVGDKSMTVEWRPKEGFGISWRQDPSYGEGPDQVVVSYEDAVARTLEIVAAMTEEVRGTESLRTLRRQLGLSQSQVASVLRIRQGAVSRLERRDDMLVSSLRDYIKCFGGELALVARFPDGTEHNIHLGTGAPAEKKPRKKT